MKKIGIYVLFILFATIIIPSILVQVYKNEKGESNMSKADISTIQDINFKDTKKIKIYNTKTKKVEEIGLEEYILGVVASEMPAAFHEEALKAQAVAARTYALSRAEKFKEGHPDHKDAPLCTDVHCQAWKSKEELIQTHGEQWIAEYWEKLQNVIEGTKGQILTYEGNLVSEPLFHSTSGGKTESSEAVFAVSHPYLKSVDSPLEENAPKFKDSVSMTVDKFIKTIKQKYPGANIDKNNLKDKIKVGEKTDTGRIKKVMVDSQFIEGSEFRQMFNLNSTNFKIKLSGDNISIETIGYGHGVGMSQWGANGMAKEGKTYKEILTHYYTGTVVENF